MIETKLFLKGFQGFPQLGSMFHVRLFCGINHTPHSRTIEEFLLPSSELPVLQVPAAPAAQRAQGAGRTEGCAPQERAAAVIFKCPIVGF